MNPENLIIKASPVQGFLWMTGALLSFIGMAIAGRELNDTMGTFQIITLRSGVALIITILIVTHSGWREVKTKHLSRHFIRNIFHFGGQFGWFLSLSFLSLATVFALEFTTPVWVALLAFFFLGERMHHARLIAVGSGLVGVVIILRPGMNVVDPAAIIMIGATLCYAVSYISTKSMIKTESPLVILFYMFLIQFPLGLVPAILTWVPPSTADTPWILLVGVGGISSHYCLTRAFQVADTLTVIPIDFLRLPLIAILGYFFYDEQLEVALFFGAVIIFLGNYYNIKYESTRLKS
jgi:drug/metabolite transporter (DMT)-like permease